MAPLQEHGSSDIVAHPGTCMGGRWKAIVVIGAALFAVVALLSWTVRRLLLENFARLEQQDAQQNVERALSALADELAGLADLTEDYASWDETYAYMKGHDERYARSELPAASHTAIRIQIMAILDEAGSVVFGKSLDLERRKEGPLPASLEQHLRSPRLRERRDGTRGVQGILVLPEGPLLVASRPILTSDSGGPARGTFVIGRYLDAWQLEKLTRYTRFTLAFSPFDAKQPSTDLEWARARLQDHTRTLVRARDGDTISGYARIEDVYEKPALLLRVDGYRRIYKEGLAAAAYLTAALAAVGAAVAATLVALQALLLPPQGARADGPPKP